MTVEKFMPWWLTTPLLALVPVPQNIIITVVILLFYFYDFRERAASLPVGYWDMCPSIFCLFWTSGFSHVLRNTNVVFMLVVCPTSLTPLRLNKFVGSLTWLNDNDYAPINVDDARGRNASFA